MGEGPRGSNGARLTLLRLSIFHSDTHNQTGPLWCWFPSGRACAHSRPLWVSPTTSPVRLGVSPAAAPTPMGVFNQRFESLFPPCWSLGLRGLLRSPPFVQFICGRMWCRGVLPTALPAPFSATLSPALWVYLCKCGATGSASARTACAICPTLRQSWSATATQVLSTPVPVSAPPTSLDIFYFLGVGPPCCSILCQFWLCEEAQCVHLRRHLGSPLTYISKRQKKYN